MRNIMLLVIIASCLFASNAYSGSGKAVVPFYGSGPSEGTTFFITNITSHDLIINIKYYRPDGSVIPDNYVYRSGFQNDVELAPKHKGTFYLNLPSEYNTGNVMVIYWVNKGADDDLFGLIGTGSYYQNSPTNWVTLVSINNGQPF